MNDVVFNILMMFIEYYVDMKNWMECEDMMCWLDVVCFFYGDIFFYCIYKIGKFFYFVFNMLELEGYKVVGINIVLNYLIWILYK